MKDFAGELKNAIVSHISRPYDLYTVCLINHEWDDLATPLLYWTFVEYSRPTRDRLPLVSWARTVLQKPKLAQHVILVLNRPYPQSKPDCTWPRSRMTDEDRRFFCSHVDEINFDSYHGPVDRKLFRIPYATTTSESWVHHCAQWKKELSSLNYEDALAALVICNLPNLQCWMLNHASQERFRATVIELAARGGLKVLLKLQSVWAYGTQTGGFPIHWTSALRLPAVTECHIAKARRSQHPAMGISKNVKHLHLTDVLMECDLVRLLVKGFTSLRSFTYSMGRKSAVRQAVRRSFLFRVALDIKQVVLRTNLGGHSRINGLSS